MGMRYGNYTCTDCSGIGESECFECGQDRECEACDGTGLDSDQLDIAAYQAANRRMMAEARSSDSLKEHGVTVGRLYANGKKLLFASFDLDPANRPAAPFQYLPWQMAFIEE